MNTPAATLAATDRGITLRFDQVAVGDYVWHSGCYRRVTAKDWRSIRMGRHASRCGVWTYEVHR